MKRFLNIELYVDGSSDHLSDLPVSHKAQLAVEELNCDAPRALKRILKRAVAQVQADCIREVKLRQKKKRAA